MDQLVGAVGRDLAGVVRELARPAARSGARGPGASRRASAEQRRPARRDRRAARAPGEERTSARGATQPPVVAAGGDRAAEAVAEQERRARRRASAPSRRRTRSAGRRAARRRCGIEPRGPSERAVPAQVVAADREPERGQPLGDVLVAPAVLAEAVHEQDRAAPRDAVGRRPRRARTWPVPSGSRSAGEPSAIMARERTLRRAMLRLYRFPYSTNVERVALALAHKGLEVESVAVDPADRSPLRELSGQDLVPVLVDGDAVVTDSTRILHHLEERFPEPPLFPAEPAARAEVEVFLDWFNRAWKREPNLIADALERGEGDGRRRRPLERAAAAPARPVRGPADRPRPPVRRVRRRRLRRLAVPALRRRDRARRRRAVPPGAARAA